MAEPADAVQADVGDLIVGVLGGTGDQGRGLALRFAAARLRVLIGSRDATRAQQAAERIDQALGGANTVVNAPVNRTVGGTNDEVARQADVVVVAVPWEGHRVLLESLRDALAGKVVVDCVNPMGFDRRGAYALDVAEGSAAQQAAAVLPGSRVVAAFHHVSAVLLWQPELPDVDCDVMVLGDDRAATDQVQALASVIPGMRGIYAGPLRNAGQVEALTANLVSVNRRYRAHAGFRITDV